MTETTAAFRFGYGLPLPKGAAVTPADMMAALRGPDRMAKAFPAAGIAEIGPMIDTMRVTEKAAKAARNEKSARKAAQRAVWVARDAAMVGAKAAVARAVASPDGLRERLAAFWADHFTTTRDGKLERALPGALLMDAIRPHVAGTFGQMLTAVTLHPAMLIYLDQVGSIGPTSRRGTNRKKGLNENLARELLELHTLGVGAGYGQDDVREMAELLTGLTYVPEQGFAFDGARVEPGPETVLGVTYAGEGTEPILKALADLAVHPATARHIAGKLAVHFVADTPDPGLVAVLEAAWLDSGGDLAVVTEALLAHPAAWGPVAEKARQPFDFVVAALRGLGVTGEAVMAMKDDVFTRMVLNPMGDMGQPYQQAGGPDGWPEAADVWINPQRLAARISWAMEVPGRLVNPMPEPAAFAAAVLGDRASERVLWAAVRAESLREGVGLVLASAEFNRR